MNLKPSKKLMSSVIRVVVSLAFFFFAFNRAGVGHFNNAPFLRFENLAEVLIGFMLGSVVFLFSPRIAKGVSRWFENLFFKVLKRVVSDFLKVQSERIRESKIKKETSRREATDEDIKKREGSPVILDTSSIIDGRILEVIKLGFLDSLVIVSDGVVQELRHIADSKDSVRRQRGRRGLDILNEIKKAKGKNFKILAGNSNEEVDKGLIRLAKKYRGRLATVDFNLNKAAKVSGVKVMNINDLVNCLKTVILPGEKITVKVIQPGKDASQGVGYLDDGTMVVVEEGSGFIGKDAMEVVVKRVIQTSAGKMIFCA
ncbi:PIN domain nuclease [Patescibacteria group bacterium]|nr:PIN domain nuclease [Patescibacteria group bacterium]